MQTAEPEIEDSFDFLFKIILVGDSDVGKTCVVQSFKSGIFIEKQQNTIGVDFTVRTLDIDGKKVKVGDSYLIFLYFIYKKLLLRCMWVHLCVKVNNCFVSVLQRKGRDSQPFCINLSVSVSFLGVLISQLLVKCYLSSLKFSPHQQSSERPANFKYDSQLTRITLMYAVDP